MLEDVSAYLRDAEATPKQFNESQQWSANTAAAANLLPLMKSCEKTLYGEPSDGGYFNQFSGRCSHSRWTQFHGQEATISTKHRFNLFEGEDLNQDSRSLIMPTLSVACLNDPRKMFSPVETRDCSTRCSVVYEEFFAECREVRVHTISCSQASVQAINSTCAGGFRCWMVNATQNDTLNF